MNGRSNSTEGKKGFWGRLGNLWDAEGHRNQLKLRKDFKLKPKLYASIGGDYDLQRGTARPHWSFTYKFDDKLSLNLGSQALRLQKKMTLNVAGASLDFSPRIGFRFFPGFHTDVDFQCHDLRPFKVAMGAFCVGFAFGIPMKTTKAIPIPGLSKNGEEVSRLDCEAGVGIQRTGRSVKLFCKEMNGIIRLGPQEVDM